MSKAHGTEAADLQLAVSRHKQTHASQWGTAPEISQATEKAQADISDSV